MDIYFHLRDSRRWTLALQERVRAGADNVTGLTYSVWLHSAIPCIFLDKTLRCEIYEARPLLCRVALSNGSPEDCKPHNMSSASGILHRTEVMAIFQNAERGILQKYNIEYHTMPIPTAILAAERIGGGELELWQAGAAIFAEHLGRF
jgi:Fe-S-cluster containining protein